MDLELLAWAIVRDTHGRVLLGRRSGTGRGDGLWNLPGGHVRPGEPAAVAAARELLEEAGLTVAAADLRVVGVQRWSVSDAEGFNVFAVAEPGTWEGEPAPLEATTEVGWFAPNRLPPDALPWLPGALRTHLFDATVWVESLG